MLDLFHPLVQSWFNARFTSPTPVQSGGWESVRQRHHTLLSAPTGSGKTLAAFLVCIDALIRDALAGRLENAARVVYVSPLKALSNDVRKNLEIPLLEIAELAEQQGITLPTIRVATRTGDTPASERQRTAKKPPHIWITTPESLYILLGSESGRKGLRDVDTLIVDEIHAVADDKRGSHLALSIERLQALVPQPLLRIGLSATVNPMDEVARLLVGTDRVDALGIPFCTLVDNGHKRTLELQIRPPRVEIGPIATHEIWDDILSQIEGEILQNRTTLVFVNTRRLVERVAHQLSIRLGEAAVVAHHGSLSRETRLSAEEKLKSGVVKVCVATASLELGIDIGTVDLVCHIGSPRSVSVCLQRVGRSGHSVGRTPRGYLFPLTRDELLECAALVWLVRRGLIDKLMVPEWPLDVLAQQIVAACAVEVWSIDALYHVVTRAWPYHNLPRPQFDAIVDMLSDGVSERLGRRSAYLHRDGVHSTLKARKGAGLIAMTSGGAIPDNADFDVIAEPDERLVGRIHEDFAVESMAGDIFLLGNTSWKIRRVEAGRVRVEDAAGAPPTIPFWLGEAPARTIELSQAVGQLRQEIDSRIADPIDAQDFLFREVGLNSATSDLLICYLVEGKRVLGIVPTDTRIVAERFFDEAGGMQLVIHAPLGARINRAWGMALRKRFCRSFDFELQAAATDDGINLSLGPQHSFPLEDIFRFLSPKTVEEVLVQAILQAPLFGTRWRWAASRALAIIRHSGGKRVPPAMQRMRSDDLLAAVFPAQVGCQDNRSEDIKLPEHPLVFEAMRDCLHEALDIEGLIQVLSRLESNELELAARDTVQPSVFSHQILNAMPYAFLDDAPLEERRARAVTLRRALPEDSRDLGRLDPEAIDAARQDAWPMARDFDELHDVLLTLVVIPFAELVRTMGALVSAQLAVLEAEGRTKRIGVHIVATERYDLAMRAVKGDSDALVPLVRGWAEAIGPFSCRSLSVRLELAAESLESACFWLEGEGTLLRGRFTGVDEEEWCDRRILARIHRATIGRLRREIEPVSLADYMRFLTRWQHLEPSTRLDGPAGLLEIIGQLQGFEAGVGAWENEIFNARIRGYTRGDLDRLCFSGEVIWGRFTPRMIDADGSSRRSGLSRVSPITLGLREDLPWLLEPAVDVSSLSSKARRVYDHLLNHRATFFLDLTRSLHLLPTEVQESLGELVMAGLASCDGFNFPRIIARGAHAPEHRRPSLFSRRPLQRSHGDGRWWLFERPEGAPAVDRTLNRAAQLLRRYGVLFRDLLPHESLAPAWRDLVDVLRKAEARGEIRGGLFVRGVGGIQFALPEAVTELRELRKRPASGDLFTISACDPLNLSGGPLPGDRIPAIATNRLLLRDGIPVAAIEGEREPEILASSLDAREKERILDSLRPVSKLAGLKVPERLSGALA